MSKGLSERQRKILAIGLAVNKLTGGLGEAKSVEQWPILDHEGESTGDTYAQRNGLPDINWQICAHIINGIPFETRGKYQRKNGTEALPVSLMQNVPASVKTSIIQGITRLSNTGHLIKAWDGHYFLPATYKEYYSRPGYAERLFENARPYEDDLEALHAIFYSRRSFDDVTPYIRRCLECMAPRKMYMWEPKRVEWMPGRYGWGGYVLTQPGVAAAKQSPEIEITEDVIKSSGLVTLAMYADKKASGK